VRLRRIADGLGPIVPGGRSSAFPEKMGWVFFRAMTGSGGETGFMRARSLSGLTAKSLVQG